MPVMAMPFSPVERRGAKTDQSLSPNLGEGFRMRAKVTRTLGDAASPVPNEAEIKPTSVGEGF